METKNNQKLQDPGWKIPLILEDLRRNLTRTSCSCLGKNLGKILAKILAKTSCKTSYQDSYQDFYQDLIQTAYLAVENSILNTFLHSQAGIKNRLRDWMPVRARIEHKTYMKIQSFGWLIFLESPNTGTKQLYCK